MMGTLAWHLTGPTLRDGRPIPPIGKTLVHEGPIAICKSGLHASRTLIAALRYAPNRSTWIHRVCLARIKEEHSDQLVARSRTIVASYSLDLCRVVRLACECAALATWCVGFDLQHLIWAAEHADRSEWGSVVSDARSAVFLAARIAQNAGVHSDAIDIIPRVARAVARSANAASRPRYAALHAAFFTTVTASDAMVWAASGNVCGPNGIDLDAIPDAARVGAIAKSTIEARAVALMTEEK